MSKDLANYKQGAKINNIVYQNILKKINIDSVLDVKELCKYGDACIFDEYQKLIDEYQKSINEKVESTAKTFVLAIPTCISLNNCVGYYRCEEQESFENFNTIKKGDVVKIEFGVNINGCISIFGETFVHNDSKYDEYLKLLDTLEKSTIKLFKVGNLNDDVRMKIESLCTTKGCLPVENTISYECKKRYLKSQEAKFMILNYKPYYDVDDNLAVEENVCFEFEENEIYNINLTFILDQEIEDYTEHLYKEHHKSHLYVYNDYFYNLKLKSSKEFHSLIKKKYLNNAFDIREYNDNVKHRIGIKESYENGILDNFPIYYSDDKLPVFHKKFTVMVTQKGGVKIVD